MAKIAEALELQFVRDCNCAGGPVASNLVLINDRDNMGRHILRMECDVCKTPIRRLKITHCGANAPDPVPAGERQHRRVVIGDANG